MTLSISIIQWIFPWAEYEPWAVRGLKPPVTGTADKAGEKGWPHADRVGQQTACALLCH